MSRLASVLAPRYEILRPLGQGGMGAVFHARDREAGREVALKTVETEDLGPWLVEALRNEFRFLAGLRHPNLVEVYDFGVAAGEGGPPAVYFTEEYLDGRELHAAVEGRPIAEWLPWLLQVCRALEFLHSRGYVHGDIKPNNVLVLSDGRVKLVDLGLASETRARGGSAELRGTPAYLAPELFRGDPIDGRTDLYALGVSLYELVAGRHPFHGQTPREWMKNHCQVPPPPFPKGTAVPPFLEHIVFRLLEKDPRARFLRANDVLEAINRGLGTREPAETDATLAGRIFSVHWVGRRDILAGLVRALEPLRAQDSGPIQCVWLEGEAGMGKSRCLRELAYRAQLEGVLAARIGFHGAGHAAVTPLRQVCRLLSQHLPEERERRSAWVREYEPFLRTLDAADGEGGEGAEPERARQCLARLVAAASAELPIVMLLDDVDLAPEAVWRDLTALMGAARSMEGGLRLLLCVTSGGAGAAALTPGSPAARMAQSLRGAPETRPAPLPPLTVAETAELSAGVLGVSIVPEGFSAWLHRVSGGVPFWIEETLRGLVAEKRVQVGEPFDTWVPPAQTPLPAEGMDRLTAFLEGISGRLSPEERGLAEAVAVLGRPAPLAFLRAATDLDAAALRVGLEGLQRRGLARMEAEAGEAVLAFTRGAMGPWLCGSLPAARREELHRRWGRVSGDGAGALSRAEQAWHLACGGVRDPEPSWWLEAAADARRTGNPVAAETILRHVLAGVGTPGREDAYRPLATLLIQLGRLDEAEAVAGQALAEAEQAGLGGARLRATGLELRASCRARRGDIAAARPLFLEAYGLWEGLAGAGDASARAAQDRLAPYAAAACAETGQSEDADRLIARHLGEQTPPQARSQFHYLRGLRLRRLGEGERSEEEMRKALEVTHAIPDPMLREATAAAARYGLSGTLRERGAHAEALDELQEALRSFHRLGQTISEISVLREMSALLLTLGRAQGALERARSAYRRAAPIGNPHALGSVLLHRGEVHEALGEWIEAGDDYEAAVKALESVGSRMVAAEALLALADLRNRSGRPSEAWDAAERAEKTALDLREARMAARARLQQAWACRALGMEEQASGRLAAAREGATPWVAGLADLQEAIAALDRGDGPGAETKYEAARRTLSGSGAMLARLRLAAIGVRVMLETGRNAEASQALDTLRASAGELDLGLRGEVLELNARMLAKAQRAYAAMAMWQDAAHFWERRRARLRCAAALAEAADHAQGLGDATVARGCIDRAAALWEEESRRVPEGARESFENRADHARVRLRARAPRAPTERAPLPLDTPSREEKTVVLDLEHERTEPDAITLDAEKDLLRAVILLLRERSPIELRRRLLEKSLETFGAARGLLLLDAPLAGSASPERGADPLRCAGARLVLAESRGVAEADLRAWMEFLGRLVQAQGAERKLSAGELVYLSAERRRLSDPPSRGRAEGVIAPFLSPSGRLLGALFLEGAGATAEDPRNAELLPFFAAHAAAALEAALQTDRLATDPATGLPTPPALRLGLATALERAARGIWPLGVLVVRAPGLETLRAEHGLAAADARLRAWGAEVTAQARVRWPDAWTGRESGDAIAVVLPGAGPEEVRALATRLAAEPGLVAGTAVFPADGEDPDQLLWIAGRRT